ncbi:MAG TPA: DJ-1/PfpI family protein [Aquimonas sp.]|jgi:putative intracellular protease/amidase/YHS domain-containing protein|nr:DJ-1/PfpI family protein [Aquimonas sp.]
MDRREALVLLTCSVAALPGVGHSEEQTAATGDSASRAALDRAEPPPLPYTPGKRLRAAFVISAGAELVDFAGPWGVFEYVYLPDDNLQPFELFTVAATTEPVRVSGGMVVVPNYTFDNAPTPDVIVVPAMSDHTEAPMLAWLKRQAAESDMTMSVCNGSFALAHAGLLSGRPATAHHGAYALLQADFPDIQVKRGARYVDVGNLATSGGLTSGIDLALHVVSRYFGNDIAQQTAVSMEYQGQGWRDPNSNAMFAVRPVSTDEHPICPVCEAEVDKQSALPSDFRGKRYYLCSDMDKARFEQTPERFILP